MSRTMPHMETVRDTRHTASSQTQSGVSVAGWVDPHSALRRFLVLKYLQVLVLPLGNEFLLAAGAFASACIALILSSPRVSRKASSVLLGQLAGADGLVLLRWSLGALRVAPEALERLSRGLLASHHQASLLLVSCVSLEALLVSRLPAESRGLRTARSARLASACVWAAVVAELLVLQAAEHRLAPGGQGHSLRLVLQACALLAPLIRTLSFGLRGVLWLGNTWVQYTVVYNKPQRRKSCFH